MTVLEGSFVTKKAGPLPVWAWMGLALGGALAFSSWSKNKTASKKQQQPPVDQFYPDSVMTPQYTFIDADTTLITNKYEPPGGGRPPTGPGWGHKPPLPPKPPGPTPAPTPTPAPAPTPAPPSAPKGFYDTINTKWAPNQPKGTRSTLWGLAEMWYGPGSAWTTIWNAPQNAGIRALRGAPEKVQVGDRFWIPK